MDQNSSVMSRTDSGLTKNTRMVPFKPGPNQKLNRIPSPRKSTFVYRKHKLADKKLVFSPPASVNLASYTLEHPLLPNSVQSEATSPVKKSSKNLISKDFDENLNESKSQINSNTRLME